MKPKIIIVYFIFLIISITTGIYLYYDHLEAKRKPVADQEEKKKFYQYWGQNKAEINRYSLVQARYGRLHQGHAILIFVTEDFLPEKKVKNETYKHKNSIQVLKLNFLRKFITGIYDYSTMLSTFTPIDLSHRTIKISFSAQEWCGHVYSHLEFSGEEYQLTSHSYFEKEVFEEYSLDSVHLEDEILTKIRISPKSLPSGTIKIIPSLLDSRLRHYKLKKEEAIAHTQKTKDKDFYKRVPTNSGLMTYQIRYKNTGRLLKIIYSEKFPYQIIGIVEEHISQRQKKQHLVTKSILTHSILSKYWSENQPEFVRLRKKLGL